MKKAYSKVVGYRILRDVDGRWKKHKDLKSITALNREVKSLLKKEYELKIKKLRLIDTLWVVRLYDMFDGWIDVSGPLDKDEANKLLKEKTDNGRKNTKYADGSYYDIFPANTRMLITPDYLGR